MRAFGSSLFLVLLVALMAGCWLTEEEAQIVADERVLVALTAIPTPTLVEFPTPLPTATPVEFPTPLPTPTPGLSAPEIRALADEQIREMLASLPTPTPILFPTPLPTATPQPAATPQPTATPQPIVNFQSVYAETWPAVVMIETPGGFGTGWLYAPGRILTVHHVISGFASVTVRQSDAPSFIATVLAYDSTKDIALLSFNPESTTFSPGVSPFVIREPTNATRAEPLMALGYSGSEVFPDGTVGSASVNVGVLSQLATSTYGLNMIMDAPVDPGDSGGPVLDRDGLVVGMVRARQVTTGGGQPVVGTFYAIHAEVMLGVIPTLLEGRSQ